MVSCKIMVNLLTALLILNGLFIFGSCGENNGLPQIYKMENFRKCSEEEDLWCLYDFKITAKDTSSQIWKEIYESQHDDFKLDRSFIHRMICIPRDQQNRSSYVNNLVDQELYGKNLTVDILSYDCKRNLIDPSFPVLVGLLITSYIAFVIQATWCHYKQLNDPEWPKTTYQKWCDIFSVIKNYQKLTENNTNADFQRLKGMQGIRVITTAVVVIFHTIVSVFQLYIDDVDQLEKVFKNPFIQFVMFFGTFAVQIFFAISAALLTNQILEVHRKHGKFTSKHCFILMLNRYFRFAPTLLILTAIPKLGLFKTSPHLVRPWNIFEQSCRRYDWYTILQVSFLLPNSMDVCILSLWYLSVDTLFYATTLAVLYITLKFHLDIKKIAVVMFFGFCLVFGNHVHRSDADDLWVKPYPQIIKTCDGVFLKKIYAAPIASWSTSCMGILLGYIYFHHKNRTDIKISSKMHILWLLTFIGFPPLILYASTKSYEGITKTIIAAIIKPIFVMPVCLGILGMAFGLGGALKKFLESNFMVIMSNTTYCSYIFHFFFIYAKGMFTFGLFHFEPHYMILWIILDLIVAFALGTACTILLEYPGLTLQKKYMPQLKKPIKIEANEKYKKID